MSINNKKTVVLSRFLCYLTIINDKLGDDERHYKCSKYNLPFATNFHGKMLFLNDKIGKLPMLSALRFVKWHFLSFVFKFFVPNLFLSLNSSNKPYCISVCYIRSVVYQEEDYDDGRKQPLPHYSYNDIDTHEKAGKLQSIFLLLFVCSLN